MTDKQQPPEEPPQQLPCIIGLIHRPYVGVTYAEIVDPANGERFTVRLKKQLTRGD